MKLRRWIATLLATLMATSMIAVEAEAAESIAGVWKLFSYSARDEETGAETKP